MGRLIGQGLMSQLFEVRRVASNETSTFEAGQSQLLDIGKGIPSTFVGANYVETALASGASNRVR